MVSPVSSTSQPEPASAHAAQVQPAPQSTAPAQKPSDSKPQPVSTANDTVQISNAANAALQEATETPQQTAQEASKGDHQAQRLMAKEAAAAKAYGAER
jgi:hypothetical protein